MGDMAKLAAFPSSPWVVLGLVGGFAVAQVTGERELGGVVLLVGGGAAAYSWFRHDKKTGAALTAAYVAAFVGSHPFAKAVGAWPSVALVTAAVAGSAWWFVDRHRCAKRRP